MVQSVPENINFPKEEEKILEFWNQIDAFGTCLKQSANKPKFTFFGACRSRRLSIHPKNLVANLNPFFPNSQFRNGRIQFTKFDFSVFFDAGQMVHRLVRKFGYLVEPVP